MIQWERILWIHAEIAARHYPNADAVSERFGVSRRTAFQDRDYLFVNLDAPLAYSRQHKGWYYTDPTFVLLSILTSERELISFWLSQALSKEYLGSPFADALSSLLEKARQALPEAVQLDLNKLAEAYTPRHLSSISCSKELLEAVQQAISERRVLHIIYYSAHRNQTNEREIEPYHLLNAQGEWHCVAWCRWRRDFRQFLLSRVQEWHLTETSFERNQAFDMNAYLSQGLLAEHGGQMLDLIVRFTPYQARWIRERQWHPSQVLEPQADGSLIMRLQVSGLAEIKRWLLSYGAEVEVLAPEHLRELFRDEAQRLKNIYEK